MVEVRINEGDSRCPGHPGALLCLFRHHQKVWDPGPDHHLMSLYYIITGRICIAE
jgi:hypothetical protein